MAEKQTFTIEEMKRKIDKFYSDEKTKYSKAWYELKIGELTQGIDEADTIISIYTKKEKKIEEYESKGLAYYKKEKDRLEKRLKDIKRDLQNKIEDVNGCISKVSEINPDYKKIVNDGMARTFDSKIKDEEDAINELNKEAKSVKKLNNIPDDYKSEFEEKILQLAKNKAISDYNDKINALDTQIKNLDSGEDKRCKELTDYKTVIEAKKNNAENEKDQLRSAIEKINNKDKKDDNDNSKLSNLNTRLRKAEKNLKKYERILIQIDMQLTARKEQLENKKNELTKEKTAIETERDRLSKDMTILKEDELNKIISDIVTKLGGSGITEDDIKIWIKYLYKNITKSVVTDVGDNGQVYEMRWVTSIYPKNPEEMFDTFSSVNKAISEIERKINRKRKIKDRIVDSFVSAGLVKLCTDFKPESEAIKEEYSKVEKEVTSSVKDSKTEATTVSEVSQVKDTATEATGVSEVSQEKNPETEATGVSEASSVKESESKATTVSEVSQEKNPATETTEVSEVSPIKELEFDTKGKVKIEVDEKIRKLALSYKKLSALKKRDRKNIRGWQVVKRIFRAFARHKLKKFGSDKQQKIKDDLKAELEKKGVNVSCMSDQELSNWAEDIVRAGRYGSIETEVLPVSVSQEETTGTEKSDTGAEQKKEPAAKTTGAEKTDTGAEPKKEHTAKTIGTEVSTSGIETDDNLRRLVEDQCRQNYNSWKNGNQRNDEKSR